MAISRVGGTKGMLSGQVGSTVYQIRNNGDGTLTQVAYAKGERTETTFSPKLQAQRMCMGMVESLMKQLKPLIGISFQAGTNKTKSCNAFSAANLRLVQRDCMEHWYEGNKFVFPYQYKGYPDFSELGGLYMISSGSLQKNLYDELIFDSYAPANWRNLPYADSALWGLKFNVRVGVDTLEQFRQAHKMTILDKICFAGFKTWISYDPDPEDPQTLSKHDYFIASFNRSFPSNVVLTPDVLVDLFQFKTNASPAVYISRYNDAICVGCCLDSQHADESYFYWAGFSESHLSGKKQISTSFYGNDGSDDEPYLVERQPAMVFGSWMGEPLRKPFPSPFAPSPVPPTPPRLPAEYQEVDWVQRLSGASIDIPNFINTRSILLTYRVVGTGEYRNYSLCAWDDTYAWLFRFLSNNGMLRLSVAGRGSDGSAVYANFSDLPLNFDLNITLKSVQNGYELLVNGKRDLLELNYSGDDDPARTLTIWRYQGYYSTNKIFEIVGRDSNDSSLRFDLVPCYRKADGFCGFYDIVSAHFYTAQTEAGQYAHGDPINS